MSYYLRAVGHDQSDQTWRIDDDEAVLLGLSSPQQGPRSYFAREGQESIWDVIRRATPWFEENTCPFHRLELEPRQYNPRIARPISFSRQDYMRSPSAEAERTAVALGIGQATALMRRLDQICQKVHPEPTTFEVFGHEIRNLLILAATEVETHWRGVLVANGATRDRFFTNDYVRLLRPMRLDGYAVGFTSFPWLASIRPFQGWTSSRPTGSLPWYDAYNMVKHDREGVFREARLDHAFQAVSACVIMLVAQFTHSIGLGSKSELSTYFRLTEFPQWEASEIYCDLSEDGRDWSSVQHGDLVISS
jgi:hypothetical protein